MSLKLKELSQVAKKTIKEEQAYNRLREELFRVFGPPVMVSKNCIKVARATNEQIDLLEVTGKFVPRNEIKISVLIESSRSDSSEIRKIVARLLPERMISQLVIDKSSEVRCAAAKRLPFSLVKESIKKFPGDDQLRSIVRQKKLNEAGLPTPKPVTDEFDMYGEEPLGDAVKQRDIDDLSDDWYMRLAEKICTDYGANLEGQWEETIATRVVSSNLATNGTRLDRDKLLKCIYTCIEQREDRVMEEGSLKSLAKRLMKESFLDNPVMPILDEQRNDHIADLLESNLSLGAYIESAEKIFTIRKASVPAGIKKYRIGEGTHREMLIPVNGKFPRGIDNITESALDRYVESWNKKQENAGEPFKLSWGLHPMLTSGISFSVVLK